MSNYETPKVTVWGKNAEVAASPPAPATRPNDAATSCEAGEIEKELCQLESWARRFNSGESGSSLGIGVLGAVTRIRAALSATNNAPATQDAGESDCDHSNFYRYAANKIHWCGQCGGIRVNVTGKDWHSPRVTQQIADQQRTIAEQQKRIEEMTKALGKVVVHEKISAYERCADCDHPDQCSRESGCATIAVMGGTFSQRVAEMALAPATASGKEQT